MQYEDKKRLDVTITPLGHKDSWKEIIFAEDILSTSDTNVWVTRIELKDGSARTLSIDKSLIDNFLKDDSKVLQCKGSVIISFPYLDIENG